MKLKIHDGTVAGHDGPLAGRDGFFFVDNVLCVRAVYVVGTCCFLDDGFCNVFRQPRAHMLLFLSESEFSELKNLQNCERSVTAVSTLLRSHGCAVGC